MSTQASKTVQVAGQLPSTVHSHARMLTSQPKVHVGHQALFVAGLEGGRTKLPHEGDPQGMLCLVLNDVFWSALCPKNIIDPQSMLCLVLNDVFWSALCPKDSIDLKKKGW